MTTLKNWEDDVNSSKENLWLVTTEVSKLLCVKFKGKFFIKDCADMLPVKSIILNSERL